MNEYWSWILTAVGLTGFVLAGKKVWWCWYINIACQALWMTYAIVTEQWGFIVAALAYTFVFTKNAVTWTKDHRIEREDIGVADEYNIDYNQYTWRAEVEQDETGIKEVTYTARPDPHNPDKFRLTRLFKLDREELWDLARSAYLENAIHDRYDKDMAEFREQAKADGWVILEHEGVDVRHQHDIYYNQHKWRTEVVARRERP